MVRLARKLLETGTVEREALLRADAEVRTEMDSAVRVALASPEPDPSRAGEFVLAPPL